MKKKNLLMPVRLTAMQTCIQAAITLGCFTAPVYSQARSIATDITQVEKSQTVVISATRYEQLLENVPMSIDVINRAELDRAGYGDIRDLARNLANVDVKRAPARFTITGVGNSTGRDANAGFSIRGQDGNRVLMVIDGVRLPRSYVNGSNAFGRDSLSMELLKQVEIVRGPSSVLYGSDGLAGLVNFVTLSPSDFLGHKRGAEKELAGNFSVKWNGDDSSRVFSATLAGRVNQQWSWLLSANDSRASELKNRGDNDVANIDRTRPNPQQDHGQSALFKLVFEPNAQDTHSLTTELIHKISDVELLSSRAKLPMTTASAVKGESAHKDYSRQRLQWSSNLRFNDSMLDRVQASLSVQHSDAQDDGVTHRNSLADRVRKVSYQERGVQLNVLGDKLIKHDEQLAQKLSVGFDFSRIDVSNFFDGLDPGNADFVPRKYFPDTRDSSKAIFLQDEIFAGKWIVTPGLRYDNFDLDVTSQVGFFPPAKTPAKSLSGSAVVPKLGLLYKFAHDWNFYSNISSGFRAPNAQQINGVFESTTVPAVLLSNPDLRPEKSRHIEFGVRAFYDVVNLDFAVFRGKYHDLIYDKKPLGGRGIAGDPAIFQTVNIDRAVIKGFEIRGDAQWGQWGTWKLSSPFAFGHTQGWDESNGAPLNSINPNKAVLGLRLSEAAWDWQANVRRQSAKDEADMSSPYLPKPATPPRVKQFAVPAATVVDLQANFQWNSTLSLRVSIENLTNRKYWNWSEVQGLSANSAVVDAYTQTGRSAHVSMNLRF